MFNDRPVEDERLKNILRTFHEVCQEQDLVGAAMVVSAQESAYTYQMQTTWNAVIYTEDLPEIPNSIPLNMRIRASSSELSKEGLQEKLQGTAWTFGSLLDFGNQTRLWMRDFMTMMKNAGVKIAHNPFGGKTLPRIHALDMSTGKRHKP